MKKDIPISKPGPIILFGSGETLPASGPAYDFVAKGLNQPIDISVLETPAGFQNNSKLVAQNVADFINRRLSNYKPTTRLISARAKNSKMSPDDPLIMDPLLKSNWVFMGPGSPTYTVRHLSNSLALNYLYAIHYSGAALTLSSAAVLAISKLTLPVYEIYKVGEDIHWEKGLDFLGKYGANIVFVPHWNNKDGGDNLDTSRCFMGKDRFTKLEELLPSDITLIGIDEQTALSINFDDRNTCKIFGKGKVTIKCGEKFCSIPTGEHILNDFGIKISFPPNIDFIEDEIWHKIKKGQSAKPTQPPTEVFELEKKRESARKIKDWDDADRIRKLINDLGWEVNDTPEGPELIKSEIFL